MKLVVTVMKMKTTITKVDVEVAIQTNCYKVVVDSNLPIPSIGVVILRAGDFFKRKEEGSDIFTNGATEITETVLERNNNIFKIVWQDEED